MKSTDIHILIIDEIHLCFLDALGDGLKIDYLPNITPDEVESIINQYDILILRSKCNINKTFIDKAIKLKLIIRAGSGLDNIDVEYAHQHQIKCINTPEANSKAVAEHTLALILNLIRHISKANAEVKNLVWHREQNRGIELNNCTVGIIGYGHTGGQVAHLVSNFGAKVLVYDKYLSGYGTDTIIESDYDQIFEQADIISFHIPLTYETLNLIDSKMISNFKKNFYLINCSRGPIMKLNDVLDGLKLKKILGLALDVLPNEKFSTYTEEEKNILKQIINMNNTILTPHVAGWTAESYQKISEKMREKLIHFLNENGISLNSGNEVKNFA